MFTRKCWNKWRNCNSNWRGSSFETEDTLKEGADGVTLLKYQPKKGVIVPKLTRSLERGESYETYQSIPVEAKITGKTTVEITLTEEKIMMWGFVR